MRFLLLLLSLTFLLCCCQNQVVEDRLYPSDYLFAQRSFPSGNIDRDAYKAALRYRAAINTLDKSSAGPWESKGPTNIQGRITDIETYNNGDNIILAGCASGGIFKSSDLGNSWEPIFDNSGSLAIGDMAVYTDPSIIYVGTGEANAGGGSLAYDGVGVYKSEDEGNSWTNIGLENVGSIGKVIISHDNPDLVYVAAMGHLFENNTERGVFRTTDGGNNWEQVLTVSDSTGAVDLAIHPENDQIIYAAMWERIRRPYNRQYGGATSGIYRTTDGGDNWIELTNGLPTNEDDKGRIGLAISPSDPNIIYVYYATSDLLNGIYKSEDGGETWTTKSINGISNVPFMWWFGKIYVHPTDPEILYVTSIIMAKSEDGADSWSTTFDGVHVDQHAIAFMPDNPSVVINGNDGGIYLSPDEGDNFNTLPGYSNMQFYTCEINPHNPDQLLGGAQDNGTLITNGDADSWLQIFEGDGFRVLVDPQNEDIIYAEAQRGNIVRSDDGGNNFVSARNGITGSSNWNTPIAFDTEESSILYTGTQALYRSEDRGDSWSQISPVLVNENNPQGNISFGTLTTIDVSTRDNDIIYVGTDDGNVWVTTDNGLSYQSISEGLPERWITSIAADPFDLTTVYVTVSGFRFGESNSQVFRSDNMGEDWISIGANLPDVPVNDIIIDDVNQGYFYLATDIGVFVSGDGGNNWSFLGDELPNVPVIDLDLDSESRTLAAATYGRGMYTFDLADITNTNELIENAFTIFPNPVVDYLTIESASFEQVEIYNMQGQQLVNSHEAKVNVSHLPKGIYTIVVTIGNHRAVQQFTKV